MRNQALFSQVSLLLANEIHFVDFPVDIGSNDFEDDGVFISADSLDSEVDEGFFYAASLDFEDGVLFCAGILID